MVFESSARDPRRDSSLTGIVLLFFLALVPYYLYSSNQLQHFLHAFHQADPSLFSRDWFVTHTANPHPFFTFLVASLKSTGTLAPGLFLIHVIQFSFLIVGIFALSRVFSKDLRTPLLVFCFLLFYFSDGLGQETLYSEIVQAADLGKLFYLFSLVALFQEKILLTWVFLGATAFFDFLSGVQGFLILLIFWVFQARNWDVKRMGMGFLIFLMLLAPHLFPLFKHHSSLSLFNAPETLKVLFNFRFPHHYRVSTFELSHIFRIFFPLFFLFFSENRAEKNIARARFYTLILISFCFLAAVSLEGFYFPQGASLRLLRLSPFLLLLGLVFLSSTLVETLKEGKGITKLLVGVTLAILFLERDSRLFIPLSLFLLLAWSLQTQILVRSLGIGQKIFLGGIFLLIPTILYLAKGRGMEWGVDLFLGLALLLVFRVNPERWISQIFLTSAILGLPTLCLHGAFPDRVKLHPLEIAPRPPLFWDHPDLESTLNWIRTQTPRDAILLTPPYQDGIRFFSERAIVVDFHVFPIAGPAEAIKEWKERIEAVSQTSGLEKWSPRNGDTNAQRELLRRGYLSLNVDTVEKLARRFGADYFLTESSYAEKNSLTSHGHHLVFENSSYLIFRLAA